MGASGVRRAEAYCLFTCRSRPLAVGLEVVAGVIEPDRIVRLPLCPRPVLGLCTYRGGFVTVVGPALGLDREGLASHAGDPGQAVLILRTGQGPWGLAIDRLGVTVDDGGEVRPDVETTPPPGGFVVDGTIDRGGTTHPILDPERTWQGLRSAIERSFGTTLGLDDPTPQASAQPRSTAKATRDRG